MDNFFTDRELSWLSFNYRVLQEAKDKTVPLIERIRFLGIYSNNRDEFYRVRVAYLKRLENIQKKTNFTKVNTASEILPEIISTIEAQEKEFNATLLQLLNELKQRKIILVNEKELNKKQDLFIKDFYRSKLEQYLFPIMLDNIRDDQFLKDGSIYLAIELVGTKKEYAILKVPHKELGRFIILPIDKRQKYFMLLDDVIRCNLEEIFSKSKYHSFNAYTIKITRDAELDFDNNDVSKTFFEQIKESIGKRKKGAPVRFVYDATMPKAMLSSIIKKLNIQHHDTQKGGARYHNLRDLMSFPVFSKQYVYKSLTPRIHNKIDKTKKLIDSVREKDILFHFPYHDFSTVISLLKEASFDPDVKEIKITLYRLASYSNIINSLVNAARNGKEVSVLLEAQARFDEEANLNLVNKLQSENVKILPLIKGFKIHTKIFVVKRKENNNYKYYSYIGTGNFNESTAKLYTDLGLLTANQHIGKELNQVFNLIESRFVKPKFKHLILSPFDTRKHYLKLIENEIKNAKSGKEAWIILKMNSLSDKELTQKLYQASQAGVKIDLIIRGICILKPGIEGLSENIRVRSIIDRFLEHSRIFVFSNNGQKKAYISSADWMVRNLDNRIEVATPIYNKALVDEIVDILMIQINDNQKARIIDADHSNQYFKKGKDKIRSQITIYDYYKNKE
ncbi:MAG: polyphosphate kinase 1 [Bacteroidales bacterium]|nr:polyphosphate kinase 1 [Bacteroidales bacterium]